MRGSHRNMEQRTRAGMTQHWVELTEGPRPPSGHAWAANGSPPAGAAATRMASGGAVCSPSSSHSLSQQCRHSLSQQCSHSHGRGLSHGHSLAPSHGHNHSLSHVPPPPRLLCSSPPPLLPGSAALLCTDSPPPMQQMDAMPRASAHAALTCSGSQPGGAGGFDAAGASFMMNEAALVGSLETEQMLMRSFSMPNIAPRTPQSHSGSPDGGGSRRYLPHSPDSAPAGAMGASVSLCSNSGSPLDTRLHGRGATRSLSINNVDGVPESPGVACVTPFQVAMMKGLM